MIVRKLDMKVTLKLIRDKAHASYTNNNNDNSVGKLIPWEMCRKFKFDYMNICYIHNEESILNVMLKIL